MTDTQKTNLPAFEGQWPFSQVQELIEKFGLYEVVMALSAATLSCRNIAPTSATREAWVLISRAGEELRVELEQRGGEVNGITR